ncbi:MAG: flavin reductase family protein [Deltaproteobacteria bacterium]|nr:flavin reductase family protein [Deltaproteobacteria bacterium]
MHSVKPEDLSPRDSHRLLTSLFIPRPIAFVGTIGLDGTPNCAPFSFANGVSSKPPVMMVSVSDGPGGNPKDTLRNIQDTGEYTVNLVTRTMASRMHEASGRFPPQVSEFEKVGLAIRRSHLIDAPGIAESPVTLELRLRETIRPQGTRTTLVLGDVVLYHVDEERLVGGELVPDGLDVVGRLGKDTYAVINDIFRLPAVEVPK